jgi:lysozyme
MNLRKQLIDFEGFGNIAYPDPLTNGAPWTIGVGHCGPEVHEGLIWTDDQINVALDGDIAEKIVQCRHSFPWFDSLNEPRQAVLVGMCFQLGLRGLLGFQKMLDRVRDARWHDAGNEMRTSLWAKQTPKRAARLASQMENGEWN